MTGRLLLSAVVGAIVAAEEPVDLMAAVGRTAAERELDELLSAEWDRQMRESPEWASRLGDLRFNRRWTDLSPEAIDRRRQADQGMLARLKQIETDQLSELSRLNLRLYQGELQIRLDEHRFKAYLLPINQLDGVQDANSLADALRFETRRDFEDWIHRLRALPKSIDQVIVLLREGIKSGIVYPRVVIQRVPPQIEKQIVREPKHSLFYKPFRSIPDDISSLDADRFGLEAAAQLRTRVIPAYRRLLAVVRDEYLPASHDAVGVWQMPSGRGFYAHRARRYTTTELTPDEIHEIGLREVRRIRGEMQKIVQELAFEGTFAGFLEHLRTDRSHYFSNPNDLLAAYRECCKRIDPELPKLFHRLPKFRYGIEPIPSNKAPDTTTAYYRPPSGDGRRPGTYFVNLYKPEARPKFEIEALSLHESVPGHHLQISLAMELDNLPQFRRYGGFTAFVEGWGLYSEKLGEELGLYRDPYSKFGQLTYEMWRAVRLVVDTGMHVKRWSRRRAIDFFADHTAKSLLDIENEIDRYIVWPGQALAYKIGEMKIRELRARAETALGDDFDVRDFHDAVLKNGAVPLDVLEQQVADWLATEPDLRSPKE